MSRATNRYEFEWTIYQWASGFHWLVEVGRWGRSLRQQDATAEPHGIAFALLLAPDGAIEGILVGTRPYPNNPAYLGPGDWFDLRGNDNRSWFLYDPFDLPEYANMRWRNVSQATMERLIGRPFTPAAFIAQGHPPSAEPIPFPTTWSVIF